MRDATGIVFRPDTSARHGTDSSGDFCDSPAEVTPFVAGSSGTPGGCGLQGVTPTQNKAGLSAKTDTQNKGGFTLGAKLRHTRDAAADGCHAVPTRRDAAEVWSVNCRITQRLQPRGAVPRGFLGRRRKRDNC